MTNSSGSSGDITDLGNDSKLEQTPVILIADDDPSIRLVLKHSMEQSGYHVIEAANGLEAVQAAIREIPDLILMDAVMPVMDGFRATEEIKKISGCQETPILMATSLDDDQSVARAFDVGACDYITKPFNWSVLKHRTSRMLFAAHAERKIRHLAYHDVLTGLPNRMLFMDRIDQAISRAQRENGKFAILYIDIDHFKVINDSMGHAAGDQLLNIVSQRLTETLRKTDTIARLGGDEFTIIIEDLDEAESVVLVAKNILATLDKPVEIFEKEVHIGGSIGIALYPQDGETFGTLLKNSDTAMYKAKELGRQTFQFYEHEMSLKAMRRLDLENQIRIALKNEEFLVYYQPKVNLLSGQCQGMEALVRWQHPEKGIITPDEFIPIAEETGLIVQLDEWVMHTACQQFKTWEAAGYPVNNLSVNISARHFKEGSLLQHCKKLIEDMQILPRYIEIELTESALVDNYNSAKEILHEIHEMGIRIALDDFGTGYASMSYLKEFPFDTVKLDRSFVQGVAEDVEDSAIVIAMIQLAKALNLNMIAEGVETELQKQFLTDHGCVFGQGYLWSKPLAANDFQRMFFS
ncbi:MAG: EAL domain-containing protein [Gammaproteobacteria bacterium]|nr:EAL domain-containing protein [Gammaproteobacteria bacterium]